MTSKDTPPFRNQLALIRKRKAIEQKQVAILLGHKTTDQISRYERGVKLPNLKTALKLGILYKIPIRVLLDGYFEACRKEVKRQEQAIGRPLLSSIKKTDDLNGESDYCSIEEKLKLDSVDKTDLENAYTHTAHLIRYRAQKMGHML